MFGIWGITGMPGSGKGKVIEILSKILEDRGEKLEVVVMGDIVRAETLKLYHSLESPLVSRVANDYRKRYGKDIWAKRTIISSLPCIIDGIRSMHEVRVFKENYPDFFLIAVIADPAIRYERIKSRARADDEMTYENFLIRDSREEGWGIGECIEYADMRIENNSTPEALKESILEILSDG